MFQEIKNQIRQRITNKQTTINKKLNTLLSQNKHVDQPMQINHEFFPQFKNLSNINYTEQETTLLYKGIKHNLITKQDSVQVSIGQ